VKVREKELAIFKAIGWKKSHILKLHLKEVMIWSFTSIFLGTMINGLFFSFIYSLNTAVAFTLFLSMVSFFFLVILISWIQLRIYLRKFT
jgi:ABC-type antimicrobial peptide transport system permease subunit